MHSLNSLPAVVEKRRKRVGRGHSSGWGKTCGRGVSGQKSRSGASVDPRLMGGEASFVKSTPKIFRMNNHAPRVLDLSIDHIIKRFGSVGDVSTLLRRLNISKINYRKLKIFGEESKLQSWGLTKDKNVIDLKKYKELDDTVDTMSDKDLDDTLDTISDKDLDDN